ncbi:MAG: hypothetical protein ABIU05_12945, partial [Nitrospirales bacterium]
VVQCGIGHGEDFSFMLGLLKKVASGVLALWPGSRTPPYAPPVQPATAFPSRNLRTGLDGHFSTLHYFSLVNLGDSEADKTAKFLQYSIVPYLVTSEVSKVATKTFRTLGKKLHFNM